MVLIAVTMGDIAGVGPECIVKAIDCLQRGGDCSGEHSKFLIIGSRKALERAMVDTGVGIKYALVSTDDVLSGAVRTASDQVCLLNDEKYFDGLEALPRGAVDARCGDAAFHWVKASIQLALDRVVDGIVTAPLHKKAMDLAGHHYPGHTEIFAEMTKTPDYCLMLMEKRFRVAHVTCHIPFKDIAAALSVESIVSTAMLLVGAVARIDGGQAGKIAVCALNPHAGDGGLFGDEEARVITPAIQELRRRGVVCEGPVSPDACWPQLAAGHFSGAVAMYHDQGHIPFKMYCSRVNEATGEYDEVGGVNITLGLPIVRTSPAHGTAFEIVGTGLASELATVHAIQHALSLAGRPQ